MVLPIIGKPLRYAVNKYRKKYEFTEMDKLKLRITVLENIVDELIRNNRI